MVFCVPSFCSRRRCAIQNEDQSFRVVGKNILLVAFSVSPPGAPFSKLPALLAEPSEEQAQSASAGASAKRKRRAKSQGQQAARPQGLKDSRSPRDVRSALVSYHFITIYVLRKHKALFWDGSGEGGGPPGGRGPQIIQ